MLIGFGVAYYGHLLTLSATLAFSLMDFCSFKNSFYLISIKPVKAQPSFQNCTLKKNIQNNFHAK